MADSTHQSDQILGAAGRSLKVQRDGGTHRLPTGSIGMGSARIKKGNFWKKVRNAAIAVGVIWVGAAIAGAMFDGIGFWGVMGVVTASCIAVAVSSSFPKVKSVSYTHLTLPTKA